MSRYLVVAHQTGVSPELRREVERRVREDHQAEFGVVVPATPVSHLFTWDDRETIDVATENLERASEMIRAAGGTVTREVVGSRAPIDAISDELREGPPYDAIIICTFPQGISRWLKLDLINQTRKRSGLPVTHVVSQPQRIGQRAAARQQESAAMAAAGGASDVRLERGAGGTAEPAPAAAPARTLLEEEDIAELDLPPFRSLPLPPPAQAAWARIDREENVSNHFRALRANEALIGPWIDMLHALWNESGLDPSTRELAILRTAAVSGSEYVWHQHVRIAREVGISDDRIAAVNRWQSNERAHFDARERAVFAYVDALCDPESNVRRARELLAQYMEPAAVLGLTMLVGFYRTAANIAEAEEVQLETRFVGWELY